MNKIKIINLPEITVADNTTYIPVSTGVTNTTRKISAGNLAGFDNVSYLPQSKTTMEMSQARENIGAVKKSFAEIEDRLLVSYSADPLDPNGEEVFRIENSNTPGEADLIMNDFGYMYLRRGISMGAEADIEGVTSADFFNLKDITSPVQAQLDSKAPKDSPAFTGNVNMTGATSVSLPGNTSIGAVSSSEIGHLDGVTINIQHQLNQKAFRFLLKSITTEPASVLGDYYYNSSDKKIYEYTPNGWTDMELIGGLCEYNQIPYIYVDTTIGLIAIEDLAPKNNPAFTGAATLNGEPLGQTNLNGTNYLMVYGTGTPEENADELQAAYDEAKKMPRHLGTFDPWNSINIYKGQTFVNSSLPIKVMIATNNFNGTIQAAPAGTFAQIASASESAAALARRVTVIVAPGEYDFKTTAFVADASRVNIVSLTGNTDINLSASAFTITTGDAYIKGINIIGTRLFIGEENVTLNNIIIEKCINNINSAFFIDVQSTATFIDCYSSGSLSFNGEFSVTSKYIRCTGGSNSFGAQGGDMQGVLENCKLTSGTFTTPTGEGKIYNCIDGNENLVNYPVIDARSYKVYTGIFTQSGDTTTTVNVLENTIGNIIWSRSGIGMFKGTLSNAFQLNKTYSPQDKIYIQSGLMGEALMTVFRSNDNEIFIHTTINDGFVDEAIEQQFIEIRVYN